MRYLIDINEILAILEERCVEDVAKEQRKQKKKRRNLRSVIARSEATSIIACCRSARHCYWRW